MEELHQLKKSGVAGRRGSVRVQKINGQVVVTRTAASTDDPNSSRESSARQLVVRNRLKQTLRCWYDIWKSSASAKRCVRPCVVGNGSEIPMLKSAGALRIDDLDTESEGAASEESGYVIEPNFDLDEFKTKLIETSVSGAAVLPLGEDTSSYLLTADGEIELQSSTYARVDYAVTKRRRDKIKLADALSLWHERSLFNADLKQYTLHNYRSRIILSGFSTWVKFWYARFIARRQVSETLKGHYNSQRRQQTYTAVMILAQWCIRQCKTRRRWDKAVSFRHQFMLEMCILRWYARLHFASTRRATDRREVQEATAFRTRRQLLCGLVGLCNVAVSHRKHSGVLCQVTEWRSHRIITRAMKHLSDTLLRSRFLTHLGRDGHCWERTKARRRGPSEVKPTSSVEEPCEPRAPGAQELSTSEHTPWGKHSSPVCRIPLAAEVASPEDIDTDPTKRPKRFHYDSDECDIGDILLDAQLSLLEGRLLSGDGDESYIRTERGQAAVCSSSNRGRGSNALTTSGPPITHPEVGSSASIVIPPLPLPLSTPPLPSAIGTDDLPVRLHKRKLKSTSAAISTADDEDSCGSTGGDDSNSSVADELTSTLEEALNLPFSVSSSFDEKYAQFQSMQQATAHIDWYRLSTGFRHWKFSLLHRRSVAIERYVQCHAGMKHSRYGSVSVCLNSSSVIGMPFSADNISLSTTTTEVSRHVIAMLDSLHGTRRIIAAFSRLKKGVGIARSKLKIFVILRRYQRRYIKRIYEVYLMRWVEWRVRRLLRREGRARNQPGKM